MLTMRRCTNGSQLVSGWILLCTTADDRSPRRLCDRQREGAGVLAIVGLSFAAVAFRHFAFLRRNSLSRMAAIDRGRVKTKTDLAVNQFCKIRTSKSRRFES